MANWVRRFASSKILWFSSSQSVKKHQRVYYPIYLQSKGYTFIWLFQSKVIRLFICSMSNQLSHLSPLSPINHGETGGVIRRSAHGDANPSGNRYFRCSISKPKQSNLRIWRSLWLNVVVFIKTSINTCTYNIYIYIFIYIYICIIIVYYYY